MPGKKIGELTPLGRNLISTDELELSLAGSTGSRKVTGAQIIGAVGAVTNVTAASPLASSGGATPQISMTQASTSVNGYLTSTDYTSFNNKLGGIHAILPIASGGAISCQISGLASSATAVTANNIRAIPFIPSTLVTSVSLSINVTTLFAGGNARILVYSNLNGKPDQKIFESANLDCSTIGTKTALLAYNFTPGQTYWLCTYFSSSGISVTQHAIGSLMNIANNGFVFATSYSVAATFGSAPTTFGAGTLVSNTIPVVLINT